MQNPADNDKPATTSAATTPASSMTPATGPATPRRRRAAKAATTTRNATKAAADTPSPRGRKKDAPAATTVRRVVQGDTLASSAAWLATTGAVLAFFISGALAAAAGLTEVNGMQHMLIQGFNPTIGSEGLGIAILANANPIAIIFASALFGALRVGGLVASQVAGIPPSFIELMQGLVMIFVILSNFCCGELDRKREIRKLRKAAS